MYKKILVALDNSHVDQNLLKHVAELAKFHHSQLILMHVSEGWVARNFDVFELKESDEMIKDRVYLELTAEGLRKQGLQVEIFIAHGEPPVEIIKKAEGDHCDLIAMASHGHRFFADFFLGSAIEEVRHKSHVPILILSPK